MDTSSLAEPTKPVEPVKSVQSVPEKPESPEVMLLESYTGGVTVMDTSDGVTSSHDAMSSSHDSTSSSTGNSHDATNSSRASNLHDPTCSSLDTTCIPLDAASSSHDPTNGSHGLIAATNLDHSNINSSHDLSISYKPIMKKPTGWKTRGQSSYDPITAKYDVSYTNGCG